LPDAALHAIETSIFDVVVIDESPLSDRAVALSAQIVGRQRSSVVIASSTSDERRMIEAYRAGASDYLVLPLRPVEVRARLLAMARNQNGRKQSAQETGIEAGPLRLDKERRIVRIGERELVLTTTEFNLLACLVRAAGRPVAHKQLLTAVWGPEFSECRHYLRLYIKYLRNKIETNPAAPSLIMNEWGVGYRLNMPMTAVA
jgi:two-component system KDP operon response regulator KdpE